MIRADFHMHTAYSTDSNVPAEEMILGAVKKGLNTICITDHHDEDYPFYEEMGENAFLLDMDSYVNDLYVLKKKFTDKIDVRVGVELGLQPHLTERYRNLIDQDPFDFVIGSVHLVKGKDPFFREEYGDVTDTELYYDAMETTLENLKTNPPVDVLGHIDYVVRYGRYKEKEYSYQKYADLIDEILRGRRLRLQDTAPEALHIWLLKCSFLRSRYILLNRKESNGDGTGTGVGTYGASYGVYGKIISLPFPHLGTVNYVLLQESIGKSAVGKRCRAVKLYASDLIHKLTQKIVPLF